MMSFSRQFALFLFFAGSGAGLFPPDDAAAQARVLPELQIYVGARSVVDLSPAELVEFFPELKRSLTLAPDDGGLPVILQRVGQNVEALFRYLPNTTSVEEVRQEVRRWDGRVVDRTRSRFEYLMLSGSGNSIGFDEYRTNSRGKETGPLGPASGFMLTTSCVWRLVHFHPRHQAESRFRYLGRTSKPEAHLIAFAQEPEDAKQVALIGMEGSGWPRQEISVLIQGIVWVDPENFQIIRALTDLLAPRTDVNLARDRMEMECAEIRFPGVERSFWLPLEANVTVLFRNFTYTNRHRYSDYRIFSVETHEKITPPPRSIPFQY